MLSLFKLALALFVLVAAALGQSIDIGAPLNASSVTAGKTLVVEVDRPNSLTGSTEVAIVIALRAGVSVPASDALGFVLYNGTYAPQYHNVSGHKPPHQNFTVTVPKTVSSGPATLSVTHLSLVGAGPFPLFEVVNVTVNVA